MKKSKPISAAEFLSVKNNFKKIGEKHGVTGQYVGKIASGGRAAKSKKAQAILADIRETAKFFNRKGEHYNDV